MKISALLSMLLALLVSAAPAFAQTDAQSSPEDRQRFVTIVHKLEGAPRDPSARRDRSWAIRWLQEVPDVTVTVCADPLGGVSELTVQYVLGMGAFVIEHSDKAKDEDAIQLAGVESALIAYRVMRTDQQSPALEKLLVLQDQGELPAFVREAFRKCRASS